MKLNREQIIKALECCVKAETHLDCRKLKCPALINDECIYIGETDEDCNRQQLADALALITSQEQRIKELTEESNNFEQAYDCMHSACLELSSKYDRLTEENERLRKNLETFKGKQKSLQKQIEVLSKENRLLLSKDFDVTIGDCRIVFSNGKRGNIYTFTEKDQIAKEMLEGGNEASGGE